MDAYLFEGASKPVHILPEAVAMGGSWEGNVGRAIPIAWESGLVKRVHDYLAPFDSPVMVDVGANTGSYALLPVLLPNLWIAAFEPNPAVYEILTEQIALNHLRKAVSPSRLALWNEDDERLLSLPGHNASGCATLGTPIRFGVTAQEIVSLTSLDAFWDAIDELPVTFLKIDTEGAEKFVLQGARETIARYRPTMLIECQPMNTAAFGYNPAEIIALVESYGYVVEWCSAEDIWCEPR